MEERKVGRLERWNVGKGPRWLRVVAALWRVNVAEELQYRANFVASLLGTSFSIGTALLTLGLFFRHTTRLGGWDFWEVVVLLGVFNALTGVIEAVLRPGIGQLASEVKSGTLDLVLARPVDAQLLVKRYVDWAASIKAFDEDDRDWNAPGARVDEEDQGSAAFPRQIGPGKVNGKEFRNRLKMPTEQAPPE